jgi:hypothetical protein
MENIISRNEAREAGYTQFFTGVPCIRGHLEVRSVANGVCYQCRRLAQNTHRAKYPELCRSRSRQWYNNNKNHAAEWKRNWVADNQERYIARRVKYRSTTNVRAREMLAAAKWTAKKQQVLFDLDSAWIETKLNNGYCELTRLKFDLTPLPKGRQNPYTASLDRIIPSKGYVKDNVRVILWALNVAFNSFGEEVYAEIARVYLSRSTGLT